jgi:YHS domain-containing protein
MFANALPRLTLAGADHEPALGGYCPVSYFTRLQAVQGFAEQQVRHAGSLYYFVDAAAKQLFEAEPEKYLPQFDGLCTTALGGTYGNRIPANPTVFDIVDGKLYLFSSERAKLAYVQKPESYIEQAEQRFRQPAVGGICLVSTIKRGKAVAGAGSCPAVYRGFVYQFADPDAQAEFFANPAEFLPPFANSCAVGVAHGRKFPADGTRLRVVDRRIYLLFDADAETEFDADPAGVIRRATALWPTVKNQK